MQDLFKKEKDTYLGRGMPEKKFKPLVLSLLFSGALNIALLAALTAVLLQEPASTSKKIVAKGGAHLKPTNQSLLEIYSRLPVRELATLLTNRDLVEEGYLKRDLALAALVAQHHFNLSKALSGMELQRREVGGICLFPGVTDEQFEAILRFAYQDKWPFTTRGLFTHLQKSSIPRDTTLEQAFCLTSEFYALETLFQKSGTAIDPTALLNLVAEGTFELLDQFAKEQAQLLDQTPEKRRRLLLSYLAHRSSAAAELLVKTDFDFVLKRLDDRAISDLVSLLKNGSAENVRFCKALLEAPRADQVWRASVEKLYAFAHETPPDPLDLQTAMLRFRGGKKAPQPVAAVEAPKARYHVVQEKESLWKIAKQYGVKVDEIVRLNDIDKDKLRPGMTLKIP